MLKEKREITPKRLLEIVGGIFGLCLMIFFMFGDIILKIGLDKFALYALCIIFALSYVELWRRYKKISASHNNLCEHFRVLRREVADIQKSMNGLRS